MYEILLSYSRIWMEFLHKYNANFSVNTFLFYYFMNVIKKIRDDSKNSYL